MNKQSWTFLPATVLGQWSVGLIVSMPILFYIGASFTNSLYAGVPSGNSIAEDVALRPALALTMLAGMLSGVLSFVVGLLAVFWKKERALLVYLSAAIGALLLMFLAGEFLFPH